MEEDDYTTVQTNNIIQHFCQRCWVAPQCGQGWKLIVDAPSHSHIGQQHELLNEPENKENSVNETLY